MDVRWKDDMVNDSSYNQMQVKNSNMMVMKKVLILLAITSWNENNILAKQLLKE